ncbi:MAG: ABC transporter permease, partial [Micromonosporaceae bacterium]
MLVRILQRLAILLASLAVSSAAVFAFMTVLPGDPARIALGVNASEGAVSKLNHEFGLDRPLLAQYGSWLEGLVTFDLGRSYVSKALIGPQIADRLQVTLWLVLTAMALAIAVAVPMGALMAVRHRTVSGLALSAVSQ